MKDPNKLTHNDLVEAGAKWLQGHVKCWSVFTEITSNTEIPDVIGFRRTSSYLIECKTSRSDFLADASKSFRKAPEKGMGQLRWFLAPRGVLKASDVAGMNWGLLETVGTRITSVVPAKPFPKYNIRGERMLMSTALRRVQYRIATPIRKVVSWDSCNRVFDVSLPVEMLDPEEKMEYI